MGIQPKYISFTSVNRTLKEAKKIYEQRITDALSIYSKFNSEFENRDCPVCGSNENSEFDKFHDTYEIAKCDKCSAVFVNPCPNLTALEFYYNNSECNKMLGEIYRGRHTSNNTIVSDRAKYVINIIKNHFSSYPDNKIVSILEAGCNSGVFLSELKQGLIEEGLLERCKLEGVDIDDDAVSKCVDTEIELFSESIEKFSENNQSKYDLIIHFELIEHLSDPFSFMSAVFKLLKKTGIHHFHTPNMLGLDNVAFGWNSTRLLAHGIFPPMHINAFTTQNISHFSIRSGFKVVDIDTPGKLDVDMVSLLSDELDEKSVFSNIKYFTENQLAVIQSWLNALNASSHMRVTLKK